MDKLQILKAWLEQFPGWGEAEWDVDLQGESPVSCRLTLEDDRVLSRTENILGSNTLKMQVQFSLIRLSYWEENPGAWVENFTQWVLQQSVQGLAPAFGVGITRFSPEKGKLEITGDKAVYTVKLLGTYETIFEVK